MLMNISKWGNSLGVRIPKTFADKVGLHEGSLVDVFIDDHHLVIKKGYSLKSLLAGVTPENIHKETSTGPSRGKEEW